MTTSYRKVAALSFDVRKAEIGSKCLVYLGNSLWFTKPHGVVILSPPNLLQVSYNVATKQKFSMRRLIVEHA